MVLSDIFRDQRRYQGGEKFVDSISFPTVVQSGAAGLPNAI
jgi:hypothetical protein